MGERDSLVALTAEAGVDSAGAAGLLARGEGVQDLLREQAAFKALGIEGVPCFVVGGAVILSDAAGPEAIADALRQAPAR